MVFGKGNIPDVLGDDAEYKREMKYYERYRAGNFKIQLVRLLINDKGESRELLPKSNMKKEWLEKNHYGEISALKVMSLEETWAVRIPQHYSMFSAIIDLFRRANGDADEILSTLFANMANVSMMPDGFYHNWVLYATRAFLVHDDDKKTKNEKRKAYAQLLDEMKEYLDNDLVLYKQREKSDLTEKEYHQAEIADEAREVLEK